jgi:hypothetical protein
MFGNEVVDSDIEHVAKLFEKLLFDEQSMRLAAEAVHLANPDMADVFTAVDEAIHLENRDASKLIPNYFPLVMHRRWLDGKLLWTVNITFCRPGEQGMLCTTQNTTAGRSASRDFAVFAAMVRLIPVIEAAGVEGPVAA